MRLNLVFGPSLSRLLEQQTRSPAAGPGPPWSCHPRQPMKELGLLWRPPRMRRRRWLRLPAQYPKVTGLAPPPRMPPPLRSRPPPPRSCPLALRRAQNPQGASEHERGRNLMSRHSVPKREKELVRSTRSITCLSETRAQSEQPRFLLEPTRKGRKRKGRTFGVCDSEPAPCPPIQRPRKLWTHRSTFRHPKPLIRSPSQPIPVHPARYPICLSADGNERRTEAPIANRALVSLQTAGIILSLRETRLIAWRSVSLTTGMRVRYWYDRATPAGTRRPTATIVVAAVVEVVVIVVIIMVRIVLVVFIRLVI